jgi:integrase
LWIGEPKTAKARRQVDLPAIAVEALRDHRQRMLAEGHPHGLVFCDTAGGPLRKSNLIGRSWHPLLEKAELPRIRFHDTRHTHATLLLSQGVHPKIVQERLGHSQIALTLDTYSHVLPGMGREAAAKLDALLVPPARPAAAEAGLGTSAVPSS